MRVDSEQQQTGTVILGWEAICYQIGVTRDDEGGSWVAGSWQMGVHGRKSYPIETQPLQVLGWIGTVEFGETWLA